MSKEYKIWKLALLIGISIVPIIVILLTGHAHSWITIAQLVPTIYAATLLWWQFLHKYSPAFRDRYAKFRIHFGSKDVRLGVFASYVVNEHITTNEVTGIIRTQYQELPNQVKTANLSGSGSTVVYMPGWQGRFDFHLPMKDDYEEPCDDLLRFTFSMPETTMGLHSALHHMTSTVIPLLDSFGADLPLKLDSVEMTLQFDNGKNPYITEYFQDIEPKSVKALECVVEPSPDTSFIIRQNSVMIVASKLGVFNSLVQERLNLHYLL